MIPNLTRAYMLFDRSDHPATYSRQASCIGARAKSLVAEPGYSGRVLAVLPDAVYLSGRDGEILWLCGEGAPLHGRGILLPFPLQRLRPGEGVGMEGQSLKIGDDLAVDLGRAVAWTPEPLGRGDIGSFVGVNGPVRRLLESIAPDSGEAGPGLVIRGLSSILDGYDAPTFPANSWELPILSPIFGLMAYCLDHGISEIGTKGRELVGLGPGLTPCGDDFLGGLFFTAHWLQETHPGMVCLETRSMFHLLQWAGNRTHPISRAILGDLAVGEGPEPLHRLLRLLLRGGDPGGRVFDAVDCLLKVGHTTGWYMLAGLLTFLLAADAENNEGMARSSLRVKGDAVMPRQAVVL